MKLSRMPEIMIQKEEPAPEFRWKVGLHESTIN
jgi:hypothetical protein